MKKFYGVYKSLLVCIFSLMLINPVFAVGGFLPDVQNEQLNDSNITKVNHETYYIRHGQDNIHVSDDNDVHQQKPSYKEKVCFWFNYGMDLVVSGADFVLPFIAGPVFGPIFFASCVNNTIPPRNEQSHPKLSWWRRFLNKLPKLNRFHLSGKCKESKCCVEWEHTCKVCGAIVRSNCKCCYGVKWMMHFDKPSCSCDFEVNNTRCKKV
jgi:hypothetical protein